MGNHTFSQFQIKPAALDADAVNAAMKEMLGNATLEEIGFNSREEFHKAIANPKYNAPGAEGEAFRRLVARMVQNSEQEWTDAGHNSKAAAQRQADWKADEDKQILREWVAEQMRDPRYETSALFRRQVREAIEKNPHLAEVAMPTPTRLNGRVQLSSEHAAEVQAAIAKEKQDAREQAKKNAMEAAARRAAMPYHDLVTGEDSDE
jgi:hypothetical protein